MAPKTKTNAGPSTSADTQSKAAPTRASNGVLTDTVQAPGGVAVNKKKQKRRQKEALRAASQPQSSDLPPLDNPSLAAEEYSRTSEIPLPPEHYDDPNFAADYGSNVGDYAYSDEEAPYDYDASYPPPPNGLDVNGSRTGTVKKKKKARGLSNAAPSHHADPRYPYPPPAHSLSSEALRTIHRKTTDSMWDTNSMDERKRIKAFWLDLDEDKRRSLVNIEKRHVLEKMKEQQKHSCSCTVCGRKRTAIEEELEVLLQDPRIWADPTNPTNASRGAISPAPRSGKSRITELPDDEEDEGGARPVEGDQDDLDEEEYSDEEYDEDDFDSEADGVEGMPVHPEARDFFQFGSSLTVKDGILTVAEDLLKNDGQKFIDMMEMLAEKRIQREENARCGPDHHHHPSQPGVPQHPHSHSGYLPPEEEDDYDDEEDDYSDDEDYDEEDDEMVCPSPLDDLERANRCDQDTMTEDQRMEEGRRMFQIFAARMFEQRVVQAYKEKVAEQRQRALIEDEESKGMEGGSEAKRAKAAEKKKRQREKAKEAKAAKDAAKEEERQRREAAVKEAEEKKKEEQRQKQEEARKKKEAEREASAEKKRRKEVEAQKRVDAERERHQEQERKAREAKAEEKRKREEAERQRREEKEAREKEARDRKAQAEKERQEQEAAKEQSRKPPVPETQVPSVLKRTSIPPTAVALPPSLKSKPSMTESPQFKVATPALPKAPTPVRPRDTSSQQTSTPHTPEHTSQSKQSSSPKSNNPQPVQPRQVLAPRTSISQQTFQQQPPMSPIRPIHPPPGMSHPSMTPAGMHPIGGFSGQLPMRPSMHYGAPGQPMPMQQQPQMQPQQQRQFMPNAPPGMQPPGMPPHHNTPQMTSGLRTAFGQQPPLSAQTNTQPQPIGQPRDGSVRTHSRQPSMQLESPEGSLSAGSLSATMNPAPIGRPAGTIKPPSGSKHGLDKNNLDVDGLSSHLGSSALLEDTDEPLPIGNENRRVSAAPVGSASLGGFSSPYESHATPFSRVPSNDTWGRAPAPFGPPGIGGGSSWSREPSGWGGLPTPSQRDRPYGGARLANVRLYTVQSCRFLATQPRASDHTGFVNLRDLIQHAMEHGRHINVEPPIRPDEVVSILDTEGNQANGGGSFQTRDLHGLSGFVKWFPENIPGSMGSSHGLPVGPPGGSRSTGLGLGGYGSPRADAALPSLGGSASLGGSRF